MSKCEFGKFYYVIETKNVVRCLSSEAKGSGNYWFAQEPTADDEATLSPSQVALIPHMKSWDCTLPKHPGDGHRFLGEKESPQEGDEFFDGFWQRSAMPRIQDMFPYRRRIEPDHVAELERLIPLAHAWCGKNQTQQAREHLAAIKAELLSLREFKSRTSGLECNPGGNEAEERTEAARTGDGTVVATEGVS